MGRCPRLLTLELPCALAVLQTSISDSAINEIET